MHTIDVTGSDARSDARMPLPAARGPLSAAVSDRLLAAPTTTGVDPTLDSLAARCVSDAGPGPAAATDDDVQLTLTMLYELHYRGLQGVDDRWEWNPALLGVRATLEAAFEAALRALVPADPEPLSADDVVDRLHELTEPSRKPGL